MLHVHDFTPTQYFGAMNPGFTGIYLGNWAISSGNPILMIAANNEQYTEIVAVLTGLFPDVCTITFPQWNCDPYDCISPNKTIMAARIKALYDLNRKHSSPTVIVTTAKAVMQRVAPCSDISQHIWTLTTEESLSSDELISFLTKSGYNNTSIVLSHGEFAVRGGIIDIFSPNYEHPVRIELFGDEIDSLRMFSIADQRSIQKLTTFNIYPMTETPLTQDSVRRFRITYRTNNPDSPPDDLYNYVSMYKISQSMEHWLPIFYEKTATLFDYVDSPLIFCSHSMEDVCLQHHELILSRFASHINQNALSPETLYLPPDELFYILNQQNVTSVSPHKIPEGDKVHNHNSKITNVLGKRNINALQNILENFTNAVKKTVSQGKKVIITSENSYNSEKIRKILSDYDIHNAVITSTWSDIISSPHLIHLCNCGIKQNFDTTDYMFIADTTFLSTKGKTVNKDITRIIASVSNAFAINDIVVHVQHGIGKYVGIRTITADNHPHDCLLILYHGSDKLYLPIENIELLKKYGKDENVELDRLGSQSWQMRKAKAKKRIRDMADKLLGIAAARTLHKTDPVYTNTDEFSKFCADFPYDETPDQMSAIHDVISDLEKDYPMYRLICGDVGVGKTEVAMRAAFLVADAGKQVIILAPTTILALQHYKQFCKRFENYPFRIAHLSRLTSTKDKSKIYTEIASGNIDIIIGTHTIFNSSLEFKNPGLIVIDEEQHFGVSHKEKAKEISEGIHVLTLTATPIPRTLQSSMSGIMDMSIICMPPANRVPVTTYILPFSNNAIREALLKEKSRNGQSFWIIPRIKHIPDAEKFLAKHVPELSYVIAHGQLSTSALNKAVVDFYNGKYDILLSTSIVESGLDIPSTNTLIVQHADMFGLAQLYQLRGRVGRSPIPAFAFLTTSKKTSPQSEQRLQVIESLEKSGQNFELAQHDLDIRGGGNLLGAEQTGKMHEVGFELYQSMLQDAISSLRNSNTSNDIVETDVSESDWSPLINLAVPMLIPEAYIEDHDIRLSIYQQLSQLANRQEIDSITVDLHDRFGKPPKEVIMLINVIQIKIMCKQLNITRIDGGEKGVSFTFKNPQQFTQTKAFHYISTKYKGIIHVLPPGDKILFRYKQTKATERIRSTYKILKDML